MRVAYLAESVEDVVTVSTGCHVSHAVHLLDGSRGSGHDVDEASDDLGEWTLSDQNQWSIHEIDALCWGLKRLALLGKHLDVADDLGRRGLCDDRSSESHRDEDVAERDHDCEF